MFRRTCFCVSSKRERRAKQPPAHTASEREELKSSVFQEPDALRDIVAVSLLPAMWAGAAPLRVAESLASALYTTLAPCFIYVAFSSSSDRRGSDIEIVQIARHETDNRLARDLGVAIREWARTHDPDELLQLPTPLGAGAVSIHVRNLGLDGQFGILAAGLTEAGPAHPLIDTVLNVAASQASIAIQNARLLTGVREREAQIQKNNIELAEANRHKDEFLAMLAHELRNPIAAISNAVALSRTAGGAQRMGQITDVMDRQVRHLTRLVDDLLDVSRVTLGKIKLHKEILQLAPIIEEAAFSVQNLISQRGHTLSLHLPQAPLRVLGDPTRLEQIVQNLLTNAAKYSNPGGRIEVHLRDLRDAVEMEVRDNGLGITPEMLGHIFDLFTQANSSLDRSEGGLGIGLTLVKTLVELHGGQITAASEGLGKGSTFTVRLPAYTEAHAEPSSSEMGESARAAARRKVLLVDDNPDLIEMLGLLLEQHGYEVNSASDSKSAIAVFDRHSPDVALLDIGLPEVSGYQLARILREKNRDNLLLIAISGYGQAEDRQRSMAAGFDFHLTKPVDPVVLFSIIANSRQNIS
jgi:signal transduction histidine kinase/ActR/RegA family two-component response regulator